MDASSIVSPGVHRRQHPTPQKDRALARKHQASFGRAAYMGGEDAAGADALLSDTEDSDEEQQRRPLPGPVTVPVTGLTDSVMHEGVGAALPLALPVPEEDIKGPASQAIPIPVPASRSNSHSHRHPHLAPPSWGLTGMQASAHPGEIAGEDQQDEKPLPQLQQLAVPLHLQPHFGHQHQLNAAGREAPVAMEEQEGTDVCMSAADVGVKPSSRRQSQGQAQGCEARFMSLLAAALNEDDAAPVSQ